VALPHEGYQLNLRPNASSVPLAPGVDEGRNFYRYLDTMFRSGNELGTY
jgi:hypothetical protein